MEKLPKPTYIKCRLTDDLSEKNNYHHEDVMGVVFNGSLQTFEIICKGGKKFT